MTNFEADDFDALISESQEQQERQEKQEFIANHYLLFLAERGVVFDSEEGNYLKDGPMTTEGVTENPFYTAARNKTSLVQLVATKMMIDVVLTHGGSLPHDFKKRLQASALASGQSSAWIELIDTEFPGESLRDEDHEYLLEASIDNLLISETSRASLEAAEDEIRAYLAMQGKATFTEDEEFFFKLLSFNLATNCLKDSKTLSATDVENAKIQIISRGLDMELWGNVVSKFSEER